MSTILLGAPADGQVVLAIAVTALIGAPSAIWCALLTGRKRVAQSLSAQAAGLAAGAAAAAWRIMAHDASGAALAFAAGPLVAGCVALPFALNLGLPLIPQPLELGAGQDPAALFGRLRRHRRLRRDRRVRPALALPRAFRRHPARVLAGLQPRLGHVDPTARPVHDPDVRAARGHGPGRGRPPRLPAALLGRRRRRDDRGAAGVLGGLAPPDPPVPVRRLPARRGDHPGLYGRRRAPGVAVARHAHRLRQRPAPAVRGHRGGRPHSDGRASPQP